MIRTLKFALQYQPANSQAIGYHATQQNAAYNHAADLLNREPHLPKRSGRNHHDALNKRITAWRQGNRQSADAPYHIHQQGAGQRRSLGSQPAATAKPCRTAGAHCTAPSPKQPIQRDLAKAQARRGRTPR